MTLDVLSQNEGSGELFDAGLKSLIMAKKPGDRISTQYTEAQGIILPRQLWFQDAVLAIPNELGIIIPKGRNTVDLLIGGQYGFEISTSDFSIGHTHNTGVKTEFTPSSRDFTSRSRAPKEGEVIISPNGLFYYSKPAENADLGILFQLVGFKRDDSEQLLNGTWSVNGLARVGALLDFDTYRQFMQRFFGIAVKLEPKPGFAREMAMRKLLNGGEGAFFQPFAKYIPELRRTRQMSVEDRLDLLKKGIANQQQPKRYDSYSIRE